MNQQELYESACAAIVDAEELTAATFDSAGISLEGVNTPGAVMTWLWKQLKTYGCENKEQLQAIVEMAITALVKAPFMVAICMNVVSNLITNYCEE